MSKGVPVERTSFNTATLSHAPLGDRFAINLTISAESGSAPRLYRRNKLFRYAQRRRGHSSVQEADSEANERNMQCIYEQLLQSTYLSKSTKNRMHMQRASSASSTRNCGAQQHSVEHESSAVLLRCGRAKSATYAAASVIESTNASFRRRAACAWAARFFAVVSLCGGWHTRWRVKVWCATIGEIKWKAIFLLTN